MLNMEMLFVITNRDDTEGFVKIFQDKGLPLSLAVLAEGTATSEVLDMMSLAPTEKIVLISLGKADSVHAAIKEVNHALGIHNLGAGIVFSIPIDGIGGKSTRDYLAGESECCKGVDNNQGNNRKKETGMSNGVVAEDAFELVIAITKEGYSNAVMEAARVKGGATGGTILHARGMGMEEAKTFFGIAISDEKEIVLVVCRAANRNKIMQAIIDEAGQNSKAKSIVFSVPINSPSGLWILRDQGE